MRDKRPVHTGLFCVCDSGCRWVPMPDILESKGIRSKSQVSSGIIDTTFYRVAENIIIRIYCVAKKLY